MVVEKGMYFEIMYAPAINDSTLRKNVIHMSHVYHALGKSKNIILTSWASSPRCFRGPYDLVNLYPFLDYIYFTYVALPSQLISCHPLLHVR